MATDDGGPEQLDVDVATATSWNADIRLALFGDKVDVRAILTVEAAEQLRANLAEAIQRVRAAA